MKNSISRILVAEHDVILEAMDIIYLNANVWKSNPAEYKKRINQLLDFFSVYADKFHHHKEEEILFPAISKRSETTGSGMVQELNEHHEEFRHLMQQIRAAISIDDFISAQKFLEFYISQLKDHIAVENDELFPMTDDIFSQEELDKLYYQCLDMDSELGIKSKKDLEDLIKNLNKNETVQ